MSRCFQAYLIRRLNPEALIKLDKSETKAEKKREKELKKISRKEHKDKDKKRHKYITCRKHLSSKGDELDQSEKSDLTLELDPAECSGSVCNVESTLKRKRQDGDLLDRTKSPRSVLRIRLPLKRSEPNSSLTKQQPNNPNLYSKTEAVKPSIEPPPCQDPKINELSIDEFLAWVPPSLDELTRNIVVDEDWLFGSRKQRRNQDSKQPKSCHVTPSWPPRAMYLPEADIYALPYAVPF